MKIPVMEVFGPTIQGEGMVMGRKTMFVRTAGCDYSCSWCDSKFTWDGTGTSTMMHAQQIIDELERIGGRSFSHVTISGGNPALHKGIGELLALCRERSWKTAVETQGSLWKDWLLDIDDVTVSPKPPSSGMRTDFLQLSAMLEKLKPSRTSLKVVVFNEQDFEYAEELHKRYPSFPFYLQVGNDDTIGTDDEQLTRHLLSRYQWLIDRHLSSEALNDAKVLPQLHTLLWGNKRGV